jgi:hypothetical protein
MRRTLAGLLLLGLVGGLACKTAEDDKDRIARLADLTTRQLIAGLNANNTEVLAKLVVVTSTTGGPPRLLRNDEAKRLDYPPPPYEQLGPGKPGTMDLRDGQKQKRIVRLIPFGGEIKVLGSTAHPSSLGGALIVSIVE